MVTVACVLKSGGDFTPEYVYRLRDGIKANTTVAYKFVCLTDLDLDCETIPLEHNLSGWWSKLELFLLKGKVVYFDLDTVINGDLDALLSYQHAFTMLSNLDGRGGLASGCMAWDGDFRYLFDRWDASKAAEYTTPKKWGDQGWISEQIEVVPDRMQLLFPDMFCSYKWGKIEDRQKASVVLYHGLPRPHQTGWKA